MKARKNFQREKFFVLSLADVPGGVLVTLPPRAKKLAPQGEIFCPVPPAGETFKSVLF